MPDTTALLRAYDIPLAVMEDRPEYIRATREGLPGSIVRAAIDLLGDRDVFLRLLNVSSGNLGRVFRRKRLDRETSEEILDTLRVFFEAQRALGSEAQAREWLRAEIPALAGETPLSLFDTFEGRAWVRQVLRAIECGEFS